MKKVLNIAICLSIVIAAVVYAAKIPTDFGGGLKGFLKTKAPTAAYTETNGWVIFTGLDAKSQLQITEANMPNGGIILNDAKMIKQKGKISGNIDSIVMATSADSILDPSVVIATLAGNDKLSIKLKGINVGTVLASKMKMVLVNDINGAIAGTTAKGIKVMTQDGDIAGDATERALVGAYDIAIDGVETTVPVPTMIKAIKAKKGAIGYVDASNATAAKPGKTKWIAKVPSAGDVLVAAGQFDVAKSAKKHVTLTEPVTQ